MGGWSARVSLEKKLYVLVGFTVFSFVICIGLAPYIIQEVQIGGRKYLAIEQKVYQIDELSRIRIQLSSLSKILLTHALEHQSGSLEAIAPLLRDLDLRTSGLTASLTQPWLGGLSCNSCHLLTGSSFSGTLQEIGHEWQELGRLVTGVILPGLTDKRGQTADLLHLEFERSYRQLMENTGNAAEMLRNATEILKLETSSQVERFNLFFTACGLLAIFVLITFSIVFIRGIVQTIDRVVLELNRNARLINSEADRTADASASLAETASEMATSLEQTSAALTEITSMARTNDESSTRVQEAVNRYDQTVDRAGEEMRDLQVSMENIRTASGEVSRIIRELEVIAFQTNLLALNAAVEAARAGEHGHGFAVVAEEVRNLALRASSAARSSDELIQRAIDNIHDGLRKTETMTRGFGEMVAGSQEIGSLIRQISQASREQAQGIVQIDQTLAGMDGGTQQLAAGSHEVAAATEVILSQSIELRENIKRLVQLVEGQKQKTPLEEPEGKRPGPSPPVPSLS